MNINPTLIKKYAELIVKTGANVQKGQIVELSSSIENAYFAEIVMEECYKAGAKFVMVNWINEKANVLTYKYAELEELKKIKPYAKARYEYLVENKTTRIFFEDSDPNAFKDVDPVKLSESQKDISKFVRNLFDSIENQYQWCIAGVPTKKWATQVFPNEKEDIALEKLWNLIFYVCRINEKDDVNKLWKEHNNKLTERCNKLNKYDFDYVEYKNSLGTDLKVKLVDGHIWKGGSDKTTQGVVYYPNLPTEEVFTMPHSRGVDGTLVSTFPLSYNGTLIKDMKFTFKDGKVIKFDASSGKETLKQLLEMDENSSRLGEIALVPYDSPIRESNTLFLSTLFDENASCHFAFGESYKDTIKNGLSMDKKELYNAGSNDSIIHVDFMVGSRDLSIIGTTKDGKKIPIFENGNFVI